MSVNEVPYTPPDGLELVCEVCSYPPAKFYRPARQILCAACVVDFKIIHMPRRPDV